LDAAPESVVSESPLKVIAAAMAPAEVSTVRLVAVTSMRATSASAYVVETPSTVTVSVVPSLESETSVPVTATGAGWLAGAPAAGGVAPAAALVPDEPVSGVPAVAEPVSVDGVSVVGVSVVGVSVVGVSVEDVSVEVVPVEPVSADGVSVDEVSVAGVSVAGVSVAAVSVVAVSVEAVSVDDVSVAVVSVDDVSVEDVSVAVESVVEVSVVKPSADGVVFGGATVSLCGAGAVAASPVGDG